MRGMVEGAGRVKDVRGGSPLALPPPLCGNYGDPRGLRLRSG